MIKLDPVHIFYGWVKFKCKSGSILLDNQQSKMGLFKKKSMVRSYDKENKKPVIKASICNGEQVAGFKDIHTGKIEEVMLIKSPADLEHLIIPGLSEPPVRTLGATIPENESHVFR